MKNLNAYQEALAGRDAADVVRWALDTFGPRVAFATSLGAEDQALTDMIAAADRNARFLTLDTGRLFPETYEVMQRSRERYGIRYEALAPDPRELAEMIREKGPNLFYDSVENRKACCAVRKTRPLKTALAGLDAWICGLRRDQAVTRTDTAVIAWDSENGLYKICPLYDWTEEAVWAYLRERGVPVNALHERGFRSIGCQPCTRATAPGEDVRAGRWWWEAPEHKECGLHRRPADT